MFQRAVARLVIYWANKRKKSQSAAASDNDDERTRKLVSCQQLTELAPEWMYGSVRFMYLLILAYIHECERELWMRERSNLLLNARFISNSTMCASLMEEMNLLLHKNIKNRHCRVQLCTGCLSRLFFFVLFVNFIKPKSFPCKWGPSREIASYAVMAYFATQFLAHVWSAIYMILVVRNRKTFYE